ncbi:MAG TPA: hypothetical protein ENH02_03675 [Bacteroidetes bacterium]|nr:hypothetical protein [Bacteroidota bacterium]
MRFYLFRTPKPKRFSYKPRYYDPEKERRERRKAELGLRSELSHKENLRLRMDKTWKKHDMDSKRNLVAKVIYYSFYAFLIFGSIYVIFFTNFVDKLLLLFGFGSR